MSRSKNSPNSVRGNQSLFTSIETVQYGKPKEYPYQKEETCRKSNVEPRHDLKAMESLIETGDEAHVHNGVVTHVCWSLKGHAEEYCKCPCGFQWRAIGEPVSQRRITE